MAPNMFTKLAAFLVADVSGRRANESGDAVFFLIYCLYPKRDHSNYLFTYLC